MSKYAFKWPIGQTLSDLTQIASNYHEGQFSLTWFNTTSDKEMYISKYKHIYFESSK